MPETARIRYTVDVDADSPRQEELLFEKAGPRQRLFFDPAQTRVAIVTCGGLCPGHQQRDPIAVSGARF